MESMENRIANEMTKNPLNVEMKVDEDDDDEYDENDIYQYDDMIRRIKMHEGPKRKKKRRDLSEITVNTNVFSEGRNESVDDLMSEASTFTMKSSNVLNHDQDNVNFNAFKTSINSENDHHIKTSINS